MLVLLIQRISLSAVFFYLGRVSILITCRTYNQPNHFLTYLLRPHGLHEYSLFFHTHPLPSAFFYIHYFFMIVPFLFSFFFLSYPSSWFDLRKSRGRKRRKTVHRFDLPSKRSIRSKFFVWTGYFSFSFTSLSFPFSFCNNTNNNNHKTLDMHTYIHILLGLFVWYRCIGRFFAPLGFGFDFGGFGGLGMVVMFVCFSFFLRTWEI